MSPTMSIRVPSSDLPVPGRGIGILLRIESAAVVAAGLAVYAHLGQSWWLFAALFLAPDLALAGYLRGPRAGAALYNAVHTYAVPLALGLAGALMPAPLVLGIAAIWMVHIGVDRMLGLGLKLSTGFRDTHLGRVGGGRD